MIGSRGEPYPSLLGNPIAGESPMTDDISSTQPAPGPGASTRPPAAVSREGRSARGVVRSIMVGLAFILACLSLVLASTTWWLHDAVLDTDRFVAITAPLADDPQVQGVLVDASTSEVGDALDLGPIGRYVVAGIAREIYASDAFARLWENGMRVVHGQVVAVLRNDSSVAPVVDGQIVVNLFPLLDAVLERVDGLDVVINGNALDAPTLSNPDDPAASRAELEAVLGRPLPPTFGVIPIADAAKLEAAQRLVSLFDAFVVVLFIASGLLALLSLALARRRLRMVALLGLGGLAALLLARLVVSSAADGLAAAVVAGGPGAIIGSQGVQEIAASYREFARVILLIALVAAVVATAAAWLLERRANAAGGRGPASVADGWFLALAGMIIALAALLLLGLTTVTLVLVAGAYAVWLAVVAWSRRHDGAGVGAT